MYISAVFSSAFLSALSAMCWQPWPMITMWPSVSPCCTQWSCSLRCVLCWFLVHMCWGLPEPWSTQGIWYGWFFVIPTLLAIICVTFSHSSSSPAAALMPMRLWFLLLVGTVVIVSSLIILISYALILSIFFRPSSKGLSKALSTCGSPITTVGLFYGFCAAHSRQVIVFVCAAGNSFSALH